MEGQIRRIGAQSAETAAGACYDQSNRPSDEPLREKFKEKATERRRWVSQVLLRRKDF